MVNMVNTKTMPLQKARIWLEFAVLKCLKVSKKRLNSV